MQYFESELLFLGGDIKIDDDFEGAIRVIELTPSVSRKLELFDEAVELLKESYGSVRTYAMQTYSKSRARKADEIETFLKKLGKSK